MSVREPNDAIQFGIDDVGVAGLIQNADDDDVLVVAAAGNHCLEGEGLCPTDHSSANIYLSAPWGGVQSPLTSFEETPETMEFRVVVTDAHGVDGEGTFESLLGGAILLGAALACSDPSKPLDTSGPDPSQLVVWQEGDMVIGKTIYHGCGTWYPENAPGGDPILVDLHLARENTGTFPSESLAHSPPPTPEHIARVEDAGGTIIRTFNVHIVRALMPRETIGTPSTLWFYTQRVRAVVRADRFDVGVTVVYRGAIDDATNRFRELRGVVDREWPQAGTFTGVLPDTKIPALRESEEVRYVGVGGITCLAAVGQ